MTLTEVQAALQAAQQEYNAAKAAKVLALEDGNRRAIADADARYDIAGEILRQAREVALDAMLQGDTPAS